MSGTGKTPKIIESSRERKKEKGSDTDHPGSKMEMDIVSDVFPYYQFFIRQMTSSKTD